MCKLPARCSALMASMTALGALLLLAPAAHAQGVGGGVRTVQPGAPGEGARVLTGAELRGAEQPRHTPADVLFMQGMIEHHAQALVMTELAKTRTSNPDILMLARRIELSQDDEILLMKTWLQDRGEPLVPAADPHAGHHGGHHAGHGPAPAGGGTAGHLPGMHGMLTEEELARLASAEGAAFDRLFLEFMIRHHEGAVRMVNELFSTPGSGQESEIFQFASHVEADQNIEIARMRGMLNAMR